MDIYLSSSIKKNFKDVVIEAEKLNANIEISTFANPVLLETNYKDVIFEFKSMLENFSGKVTLHGAFLDLNPASRDPAIVAITKDRYLKTLEAAKELNAKTIVFHSGYNGLVKSKVYKYKFIDTKIDFWKEFIKNFEDSGITVALENTYEEKPAILLEIVEKVNSNYLKCCIDTGHVNINSTKTLTEWIEKTGKYLHHVHLHNNFGDFDDHLSLKEGSIDFKEVVDALKTLQTSPNLVIEIFKLNSSLESYHYLKELL